MTQINPFTGAIVQSMQVQPRLSAEKDRQIRRMQNLTKNAALQGDRLEHQVESADALHPADDGQDSQLGHQKNPQQHPPKQDEPPHIDFTA